MLRCLTKPWMLAALACATLGEGPALVLGADGAPLLRVAEGSAQLAAGREVRRLEPRSGALALREACRIECGALSTLELAWRGAASATVVGPAALELEPGAHLVLEAFQRAEIEVRRGKLALGITGLGSLELGAGALRVRSLPDGVYELLNRGGAVLELWRGAGRSLRIEAGRSLRLRAALGASEPGATSTF